MSLSVETGSGISGAESYATTAQIDAYWAARTHNALYTAWSAVTNTTAKKEGQAREATAYLDAVYGPSYRGVRRGYVQGLAWPRVGALDDDGYPLPDLPPELVAAVCELAPLAISATLTPAVSAGGGVVKRVKAGSVEVEYADNGSTEKSYPAVARLLAPLLRADGAYYFGSTSRRT